MTNLYKFAFRALALAIMASLPVWASADETEDPTEEQIDLSATTIKQETTLKIEGTDTTTLYTFNLTISPRINGTLDAGRYAIIIEADSVCAEDVAGATGITYEASSSDEGTVWEAYGDSESAWIAEFTLDESGAMSFPDITIHNLLPTRTTDTDGVIIYSNDNSKAISIPYIEQFAEPYKFKVTLVEKNSSEHIKDCSTTIKCNVVTPVGLIDCGSAYTNFYALSQVGLNPNRVNQAATYENAEQPYWMLPGGSYNIDGTLSEPAFYSDGLTLSFSNINITEPELDDEVWQNFDLDYTFVRNVYYTSGEDLTLFKTNSRSLNISTKVFNITNCYVPTSEFEPPTALSSNEKSYKANTNYEYGRSLQLGTNFTSKKQNKTITPDFHITAQTTYVYVFPLTESVSQPLQPLHDPYIFFYYDQESGYYIGAVQFDFNIWTYANFNYGYGIGSYSPYCGWKFDNPGAETVNSISDDKLSSLKASKAFNGGAMITDNSDVPDSKIQPMNFTPYNPDEGWKLENSWTDAWRNDDNHTMSIQIDGLAVWEKQPTQAELDELMNLDISGVITLSYCWLQDNNIPVLITERYDSHVTTDASAASDEADVIVYNPEDLVPQVVNVCPVTLSLKSSDVMLSVGSVEGDTDAADVVYYNLQGQRIKNPTPGSVVIAVSANKASKVLIR